MPKISQRIKDYFKDWLEIVRPNPRYNLVDIAQLLSAYNTSYGFGYNEAVGGTHNTSLAGSSRPADGWCYIPFAIKLLRSGGAGVVTAVWLEKDGDSNFRFKILDLGAGVSSGYYSFPVDFGLFMMTNNDEVLISSDAAITVGLVFDGFAFPNGRFFGNSSYQFWV